MMIDEMLCKESLKYLDRFLFVKKIKEERYRIQVYKNLWCHHKWKVVVFSLGIILSEILIMLKKYLSNILRM